MYSEGDKHWTSKILIDWLAIEMLSDTRIKNTWIDFSTANIAKKVVAHCTFLTFQSRAAWNDKIVACSLWAA